MVVRVHAKNFLKLEASNFKGKNFGMIRFSKENIWKRAFFSAALWSK